MQNCDYVSVTTHNVIEAWRFRETTDPVNEVNCYVHEIYGPAPRLPVLLCSFSNYLFRLNTFTIYHDIELDEHLQMFALMCMCYRCSSSSLSRVLRRFVVCLSSISSDFEAEIDKGTEELQISFPSLSHLEKLFFKLCAAGSVACMD